MGYPRWMRGVVATVRLEVSLWRGRKKATAVRKVVATHRSLGGHAYVNPMRRRSNCPTCQALNAVDSPPLEEFE
jgi:hypothetical protein